LINRNEIPVNPVELFESLCSVVMGRTAPQDREASFHGTDAMPEAELIFDIIWELRKKGVNLRDVFVGQNLLGTNVPDDGDETNSGSQVFFLLIEVWLVGFEKDKTKGNPRATNFAKKREAFEASFVRLD
jgi:hypothetical protein